MNWKTETYNDIKAVFEKIYSENRENDKGIGISYVENKETMTLKLTVDTELQHSYYYLYGNSNVTEICGENVQTLPVNCETLYKTIMETVN